MDKYIAHSENLKGEKQKMKQHCEGVAQMMTLFSLSDDFSEIFSTCGLLHDIGKYSKGFQNYIRSQGNKEPHARWGAYWARINKLVNLSFPIYGHHGGLPNKDAMMESLESCNDNPILSEIQSALDEDGIVIPLCDNKPFNAINEITQKELLVRMLFSSLVDADSLDTERHFNVGQYEQRPNQVFDADILLSALNYRFSLFTERTPLNDLRTSVRLYAQNLSSMPQGCFSLTLPTGMGKTLCSLNWALHHAKAHPNIKRIVIVLPFISIIDQTASELRSIFMDHDVVLEHHSNVIYDNTLNDSDSFEEENDSRSPKQLATENWDYPIVITTAVQFFESLFSNQRSKCRKLHNLQDSIVIFDEIQTLPIELAECTMRMLNDMLKLCRCSFLLCTATQPNFQTRMDFKGIDNITSLVEDPNSIFEATERVRYCPVSDYKAQTIDSIAELALRQNQSVLIVCNTKKKALNLFECLNDKSMIPVLHLSTNMCQTHRMDIISRVRTMLKKDEKIILCSTQLIEAGVDMDFPIVFRELAPLESVIQSAGRCNREGKLEQGKVFLFQLEDKGQPSKQYETFAKFAQLCYQNNEQRLAKADFYTEYYSNIIKLYAPKDEITPEREKLMFQNVADKYRLINSNTFSLFVYRYDEYSLRLYNEIKDKDFLNRNDYQRIAQYCVQVYDRFERENKDKIVDTPNGLKLWSGAYSAEYGLSNEDEIYYI